MKLISALACMIWSLLSVGCAIARPVDFGKVSGGRYENAFFGFSMEVPGTWFVPSREASIHMFEQSRDIIAGSNRALRAWFDASEKAGGFLMLAMEYEPGAPVHFNPMIVIGVEDLQGLPTVKTGRDDLLLARRMLRQSQIRYEISEGEFGKRVIGGQEFFRMDCSSTLMGIVVKNEVYSAVLKGYALSIQISYVDDNQRRKLEQMISSMVFR